ncbi:MAG: sodium:solute symporter [Pseudomonadota bacterium]
MATTPQTRLVNPRLGTYFGIFASTFVALVILALIFEQLGTSEDALRLFMLIGPLVLLLAIGAASYTAKPLDFFASGRRVPAVYCGLGLAATAIGASGIVTMAGLLFVVGFDGLFVLNGALAGFVVMAILLAPFLRKFGTFTIPTYLARRFESRLLRTIAAGLIAVPCFLFLIAELSVATRAAAWLTGQSPTIVGALIATTTSVILILGGMRALTWTNVAAAIASLLALCVPVTIIAVMMGYLPLPHLSHGPILRAIGTQEAVNALPVVVQPGLVFSLTGEGTQIIAKRFSDPFGTIGPLAYVFATLTIMFGIAGSPWLLPRIATTPGVYEARKTLGWATFFFGFMIITIATITVFMRHYLMEVPGTSLAAPPEWLRALISEGFADVASRGTRLAVTSVAFERDSILMALPMVADLPRVFEFLAAAGIVVAGVAGASAATLTIANLLAEDVVHGLSWKPAPDPVRFATVRILLLLVLALATFAALTLPSDPLKLLLWALAMNGATVFPVLVASIWWKRINLFGAIASMATGFIITVLVIIASEAGMTDISSALSGMIAVPASIIAGIAVSLVTPTPSRHALELVRDLRIPGGEILYDREMRLARLKERRRAAT